MTDDLCAICQFPLTPGSGPCPSCGAPREPETTRNLPVGSTLHYGKFTVGRVLGEGGFGITYKGAHRELRRPVAIKELFPAVMGSMRVGTRVSVPTANREDFRRAQNNALEETRVITGFRSPHIVDVHDMFRENGTAYIVMEYLDAYPGDPAAGSGDALRARGAASGPEPVRSPAGIATNECFITGNHPVQLREVILKECAHPRTRGHISHSQTHKNAPDLTHRDAKR